MAHYSDIISQENQIVSTEANIFIQHLNYVHHMYITSKISWRVHAC